MDDVLKYNTDNFYILLGAYNKCCSENRYADAIALLDEHLAEFPIDLEIDDISLLRLRAVAHMELGQMEEAIKYYMMQHRKDPADLRASHMLLQLGDYSILTEPIVVSFHIDLEPYDLMEGLPAKLSREEKEAAIEKAMQQVHAAHPGHPLPWMIRTIMYEDSAMETKVSAERRQALLEYGDAWVIAYVANCCYWDEAYQSAAELALTGMQLDNQESKLYFVLANSLHKQGDSKGYMKTLLLGVKNMPDDGYCNYWLAHAYEQHGKTDKALEQFRAASRFGWYKDLCEQNIARLLGIDPDPSQLPD